MKDTLIVEYKNLIKYNQDFIASLEARVAFQNQELDKLNKKQLAAWEATKLGTLNFNVGDSVCNYSNQMGFIEAIYNNKIKVLWTKKADNQPKGFWFGNMGYDVIDRQSKSNFQYSITKSNEFTWEVNSKISTCPFNA
jgi:hypothetical protein